MNFKNNTQKIYRHIRLFYWEGKNIRKEIQIFSTAKIEKPFYKKGEFYNYHIKILPSYPAVYWERKQ